MSRRFIKHSPAPTVPLLRVLAFALTVLCATSLRAEPPVVPPAPAPAELFPPLLAEPVTSPAAPETPVTSETPGTTQQPSPTDPKARPEISPPPSTTSALKALIDDGVQLYEKGDYDGAIRDFTQGYALRPKPLFLFNIAQAYRKSGQDMNALAFYEKFQLADPDSRYRPETQAYIAYLRVKLGFDPAPPPAVHKKPAPVYKRGWFWVTIIGVAALTAGGIALGTVLGSDAGLQTTLGTIEPRFHQ